MCFQHCRVFERDDIWNAFDRSMLHSSTIYHNGWSNQLYTTSQSWPPLSRFWPSSVCFSTVLRTLQGQNNTNPGCSLHEKHIPPEWRGGLGSSSASSLVYVQLGLMFGCVFIWHVYNIIDFLTKTFGLWPKQGLRRSVRDLIIAHPGISRTVILPLAEAAEKPHVPFHASVQRGCFMVFVPMPPSGRCSTMRAAGLQHLLWRCKRGRLCQLHSRSGQCGPSNPRSSARVRVRPGDEWWPMMAVQSVDYSGRPGGPERKLSSTQLFHQGVHSHVRPGISRISRPKRSGDVSPDVSVYHRHHPHRVKEQVVSEGCWGGASHGEKCFGPQRPSTINMFYPPKFPNVTESHPNSQIPKHTSKLSAMRQKGSTCRPHCQG